jgi:hypothetical protein
MQMVVESPRDDLAIAGYTPDEHRAAAAGAAAGEPAGVPSTDAITIDVLLERMLDLAKEIGYREAQQAVVQERVGHLERGLSELSETLDRLQSLQADATGHRSNGDAQPAGAAPMAAAMRRARFEPIRLKTPVPPVHSPTAPETGAGRGQWSWIRLRVGSARAYGTRP